MRRNKKTIILLSTIFTIVIGVAATYAFFFYGKRGEDITIDSGDVTIDYAENSNYFTLHSGYPKSDLLGSIDSYYYDFTVSGSRGENDRIKYELQIIETDGNTLDSRYVKVYLTDQDDNTIVEPVSLSELYLSTYNNNRIIYTDYIEGLNQVDSYRLRMWIDSSYTNNVANTLNFQVNLYAKNEKL